MSKPPIQGNQEASVPSPLAAYWKRFVALGRAHHRKTTLALVAVILALGIGLADSLLAGPLRKWAERMVNSNLNGYTVQIGWMRPHFWKLAFELEKVVLVQNSHPDPPVAEFGALKFSLAWNEMLHFKLAGNLTIERPALHINLPQIQEETHRPGSLKDRGWQQAVEAIYPIKLDRVNVVEGSLLYLSGATASKPLQLTEVFMDVQNVRNIAAAKGSYPSPVILEGALFDSGRIWFKGAADFLREPHAAAKGELRLASVPLDRLNPLTQDFQLRTTGGLLSAMGVLEYTPEAQTAHLQEVLVENLKVDYVTSNATKALEKRHRKQVVTLAKSVRNTPQLFLKMDSLKLRSSQLGFVNEGSRPPYRLFLSGLSLDLDNLTNQADQGHSAFQARGAFMGNGATVISGQFKPTATPVECVVRLKLAGAQLSAFNPFFLAHGGVDVAGGVFSDYTEFTMKNGRIEGYTKPLIRHLKIYDRQKDQGKSFGKRVKLHTFQILANLFKNHSTKEVATVIRFSGPTGAPQTSTWEVIRKLLGNGLGRGILPGFLANPPAKSKAPVPKRR